MPGVSGIGGITIGFSVREGGESRVWGANSAVGRLSEEDGLGLLRKVLSEPVELAVFSEAIRLDNSAGKSGSGWVTVGGGLPGGRSEATALEGTRGGSLGRLTGGLVTVPSAFKVGTGF